MPFVRCVHSSGSGSAADAAIAAALSRAVASALGKPEAYVCVHVERPDALLFGGTAEPAAMVTAPVHL